MLTEELKTRIEAATLTIETAERGNGRAFLVAGGYLLTAAHCVDFDLLGGIVLGENLLQWVETRAGERFRVSPVMIDPVSDIAVLGFPDNQNFYKDCDLFEEFIEETSHIDVEFGNPSTDDKMHVFTNLQAWICCKAWMADSDGGSSSVFVSTRDAVTGGISGSAIVNEFGKAVAIMSNFSEPRNDDDSCSDGPQPLIHQNLSKLLHDKIHSRQTENQSSDTTGTFHGLIDHEIQKALIEGVCTAQRSRDPFDFEPLQPPKLLAVLEDAETRFAEYSKPSALVSRAAFSALHDAASHWELTKPKDASENGAQDTENQDTNGGAS